MSSDWHRVLGPHLLLAPLADGGMGAVFLATQADPRDARGVAQPRHLCLVKTLKTGLATVADYRPRFIDEMRVAVLLRHDNLCQVYGGGESGGEFYLSMELIEGVTFKRLLSLLQQRQARLTTTQAAALAVGLLRGLHAAHTMRAPDGRQLGVVHRDVSPHNAMVDVHGRIKVIDFGLATSVLKETFTESAVVLGKSAYMAPEQARGEDVDAATDQYAAAIVLYELLTDDRFYGDMPTRSIWTVVGSGTHRPRAWDAVPAPCLPILKRALSARAADRFPSCAAFADAIAAVEPFAESTGLLEELGATVAAIDPDELRFIASARAQMQALGSQVLSTVASTLPSPPRTDPTERLPSSPHHYGQTESASRSLLQAAPPGSRDTAETAHNPASTSPSSSPSPSSLSSSSSPVVAANSSPLLAPPSRRRAALIGSAVAVAVIAALVVGGLVVRRRLAQNQRAADTQLQLLQQQQAEQLRQLQVLQEQQRRREQVPTPTPTPTPTPIAAPPVVPTSTSTTPTVSHRVKKLRERLKRLGRCDENCVREVRRFDPQRDADAFEAVLSNCEERCQ